MCVGLPGRVVEVAPDGSSALVDVHGATRRVSLALLAQRPQRGEWVVVQLGFAMERMTESEAAETLHLLRALEETVADDLALGAPAG